MLLSLNLSSSLSLIARKLPSELVERIQKEGDNLGKFLSAKQIEQAENRASGLIEELEKYESEAPEEVSLYKRSLCILIADLKQREVLFQSVEKVGKRTRFFRKQI